MQVTFLGTSSGVPTRARNVSAVALRLPQRSEMWLFDCGEGTQHQFLRSDLRLSQLRRVFITHMHGDHVFGLPGLLASLGLAGSSPAGVDLYGPDPLESYLNGVLRTSSTRIGYPLAIHRVRDAAEQGTLLFEDDDFTVRCTPLTHRVPAYAYRIEQKPLAGRFDIEKARELNIPPGPVYAQLKRGETVTLEDGRSIDGTSLCGEERPGVSVVYCTDTVFCEAAVDLARGADLAGAVQQVHPVKAQPLGQLPVAVDHDGNIAGVGHFAQGVARAQQPVLVVRGQRQPQAGHRDRVKDAGQNPGKGG